MHKLPVILRTTDDERVLDYQANRALLKNLGIQVTVDVDDYHHFQISDTQGMLTPSLLEAAVGYHVTDDDISYGHAHDLRGMEVLRLAVERELVNRLRQ